MSAANAPATIAIEVTVDILERIVCELEERTHTDFGGARVCNCDACVVLEWAENALYRHRKGVPA